MPDPAASSVRAVYADLMDLKDEIVTKLVGKTSLTDTDIRRIRKVLDAARGDEIAAQMVEELGRHAEYSAKQGVEMIDRILVGEKADEVLRIPATTLDVAGAYQTGAMGELAPVLVEDVRKLVTLSYLGQRTPDEIARKIAGRFDVAAFRAMTIVRTEGKRLQNMGAEARIIDTSAKAKSLGIPMRRTWIHSSGAVKGFAKGKKRALHLPRPHHKAMHGESVPVEEKFHLVNAETGEAWDIDGPHDPNLPAGEVVNCHCDRSIRIDRKAKSAGTVKTDPVPTPTPKPAPAPAPAPVPKPAAPPARPKAPRKPKAEPVPVVAKPVRGSEYKVPKEKPGTGAPPVAPKDGTYSPIDKELAKKTDAARALLDGTLPGLRGYRNSAGGEIVRQLGLDGKPKIVSTKEYAALPGREYHRGVSASNAKTAEKYADQFYRGKLFYGRGIYGDGIYAATSRTDAVEYAKLGKVGKMTRFKLNPDAKIVDIDNLRSQLFTYRRSRKDVLGVPFDRWQYYTDDEFAILLGFDAIYVETHGYLVLLNRTAAVSDGVIGEAE